jgi:tRNA (mo5U34)-methyltransferase
MNMTKADPFDYVHVWNQERSERGWWHSFELPDGARILGVCGLDDLKNRISQFPIPQDLRGKRVLDIGAWDGWFSFEMERRGGEVLAIDNWDNPRFHEMRSILGSRVEYRQFDMYDLTPERVGRFDIVLFMGVLYHLKHPLLALERVCALTRELAAVDSFVLREDHRPGAQVDKRPLMEFYENDEFGGQTDNWIGPSIPCLLAMCRTAGFARVELRSVVEKSACVACYRHWDSPSKAEDGPELIRAAHDRNHGINFNSQHDEYVSVWFRWHGKPLGRDDVQPEVEGYGVRPIHVAQFAGDQWQANFKLPPGLAPGWRQVRIRVLGSRPGSAQRIAVDVPLPDSPIHLKSVCDGTSWTAGQLDLKQGRVVSLWIEGLPENADTNNLRVLLNGWSMLVTYLQAEEEDGARQVNAELQREVEQGEFAVSVELGGQRTNHVALSII